LIERYDATVTPKRLTFISDLHLFSSRCNAGRHQEQIEHAVEWSDLCVWGGDMFDFRWSRLEDEAATVDRAIAWLNRWQERFPDKTFVYLDGNHDAHEVFSDSLRDWAAEQDRFRCGLDALRVQDVLLIHGDVIEGRGRHDRFLAYRQRWRDKPAAGPLRDQAYQVAVSTGVHLAVAGAAHRKQQTCRRLLRWMRGQPASAIDGVKRVAFGHTHRAIHGLELDGIAFYNGGATIHRVPFYPVRLEMPA